tara:strand:- start:110 stop:469 length:360 start_codon:yes stop_codon:yes gene_type:complete
MIGHDVIPHNDEHHNEHNEQVSFTNVSETVDDHNSLGLGHLLSHLQHTTDNNFVLHSIVKIELSKQQNQFVAYYQFINKESQELWYANLEKQRFRDYGETACQNIPILSHSLRGPPSFC